MLKSFHTSQSAHPAQPSKYAQGASKPNERSIGELLRCQRGLSESQIGSIATYQRERGLRFGEAAVALNLVDANDVLWALSQQFHYPYSARGQGSLSAELVLASDPFSTQAEIFRDLCSQILMCAQQHGQPRQALGVLSPDVGDGKSYLAANLAVACSQVGGRTLLVDADMRSPRQHEIFGLDNATGLSCALAGRSANTYIHAIADLPSLFVMPVGPIPPNPMELLQRPAFAQLLNELLSKFDHVVIDTPAFSRGADARVIAARCGLAITVGRKGSTRMSSMNTLISALSAGNTHLAGVVMNEY
jgi:protein-tyrosine kinase